MGSDLPTRDRLLENRSPLLRQGVNILGASGCPMLGCPMSHVRCICHITQRPDEPMVSGSLSHLTDSSDMGHWTSQHWTSECAKELIALSEEGTSTGVFHG